jgi:hypothetical protein
MKLASHGIPQLIPNSPFYLSFNFNEFLDKCEGDWIVKKPKLEVNPRIRVEPTRRLITMFIDST